MLFSGTLRFNLDPFGVYTDSELLEALEHAHMLPFVEQHILGEWVNVSNAASVESFENESCQVTDG